MKNKFTISHSTYMMTIAQVIEAIESITTNKVVSITEEGGRLTFHLEAREPETMEPRCENCGSALDTELEKITGQCHNCYPF